MREKIRTELCPWQQDCLHNNVIHFALVGGIAIGKTCAGAHFVIKQICQYPELTGMIAANSYDQLSQATLRELFYWLEKYQIQYVVDRMPPPEWNADRAFKSYNNILSIKIGDTTTHIFTRVLSDPDALRGIEFSWYWCDESRDTPPMAFDIILSRLRESEYIKGLITTTPNAEDWVWQRFVQNADKINFGSIHVATSESVKYGLITEAFYQMLRSSYSPSMAAQELDALHVITLEGRAYYCASDKNKIETYLPDPDLPLIVGCDFNFAPEPMVWVIAQETEEGDIIAFDELHASEVSTVEMAGRLARKYGDFFLKIFGDASGTRVVTASAGISDFQQIAMVLGEEGVAHTIDTDQANPRIITRVENVNRLLKNANGESQFFWVRNKCNLLQGDLERVTWRGSKLSDNGDHLRTHASDAIGYALFKLKPPLQGRASFGLSVKSQASTMGVLQ